MATKNREQKKYHLRTNNKEILPVQNKLHLNINTFLFLFILVFLLICVVRLATRKTTGYFEVVEGDNGKASVYNVFVSRDETIVKATKPGYVNYIVNQGDRVRVNQGICTLDEKGDFIDRLRPTAGEKNNIDTDTLKKVRNAIRTFAISYSPDDFQRIYAEKASLRANVTNLLTEDIIRVNASATDDFTYMIVETENSGIFTNTYDGYEDFNPDEFYSNEISLDKYEMTTIKSGDMVEKGSTLYKLINSDKFSIIFQMTEEDVLRYWSATSIDVYFPSLNKQLTGQFSFVFAADDKETRLARVDFKECGYLFANLRSCEIQINSSISKGLKIPSSSVATKDYYIVPKDFLTKGGNVNSENKQMASGFSLQAYEGGTLTVNFVEAPYRTFEDYLLVDAAFFNVGDILLQTDTGKTYEIGAMKSLKGIYNVNKGYAVFKPITILDEMDNGFLIIEKGVTGSVSLYDHIALNADRIQEGELIY